MLGCDVRNIIFKIVYISECNLFYFIPILVTEG